MVGPEASIVFYFLCTQNLAHRLHSGGEEKMFFKLGKCSFVMNELSVSLSASRG